MSRNECSTFYYECIAFILPITKPRSHVSVCLHVCILHPSLTTPLFFLFPKHRQDFKGNVASSCDPWYWGRSHRLLPWLGAVWTLSAPRGATLGGGGRTQWRGALWTIPGETQAICCTWAGQLVEELSGEGRREESSDGQERLNDGERGTPFCFCEVVQVEVAFVGLALMFGCRLLSLWSTSPPASGPVSTVCSTRCSCELNITHDFILALRFSFLYHVENCTLSKCVNERRSR